ncbi:MAG: hypothetical protein KAK00_02635 [Nanoarchaeota archaeon]|nr:hypothetical protein [Nanoarchaeota archaeon]
MGKEELKKVKKPSIDDATDSTIHESKELMKRCKLIITNDFAQKKRF